jgi:phage gpG-like protein
MSDLALDLDVKALNDQLDALLASRKTRPLMERLGRVLRSDAKLNFRRQAGPDGTPWKPTARGGRSSVTRGACATASPTRPRTTRSASART